MDDGGGGGGGITIFSIVQTWSSISTSGSFGYLKLLSVPATDCISRLVSISIEISELKKKKITRVTEKERGKWEKKKEWKLILKIISSHNDHFSFLNYELW